MFISSINNIFALVLLFIIFFVKWLYKSYSRPITKKKNLPPSPRNSKLPIIGNLHQIIFSSHPHRKLQSLSQKYGSDLMLLHFGTKPVLVVSSANAAREILKTHDSSFASRPKLTIPEKLLYNSKDIAFSPYGEYWRVARSICFTHFLSNKMVQSFRCVREEETSLMIRNIVLETSSSSSCLINLSDVFVSLTNGVICRTALGKKYGGKKTKVALTEFVELLGTICIGDYVPWLSWWNRFNGLDAKLKRVHREIDELIEIAIQEHAAARRRCPPTELYGNNNNNQDFVDILLDLQSNNNSSKIPIERDTIKAIVLDMFVAGTDTTYSSVEWAMTELLRHPKIMKKLQNEVREVVSIDEEVKEDDIEKMHYLKAVIKETLRLHFPAPLLVSREATRDVKVMGYDVSAGTQVIINGWNMARDPNFWDNPEEFQPDRFYYNNSTADTNTTNGGGGGGGGRMIDYRGFDFEFIPFGAGRRICPGINYAIAVAELCLAKLIHKFDFGLPNNNNEEEEKCDHIPESSGVVVHRKFPLHVVARVITTSANNLVN